jgi:hypothetical protein
MFYLLKHTWFSDLGATEKNEAYFENRQEYQDICKVLYEEYAEMFPEGDHKAEIAALKDELNDLQNSVSFRLGRALTFIPRIIRDIVRNR